MSNFDQGWREMNTPQKVETAADFLITFIGMMLIVGMTVTGVLLVHDYYHGRITTEVVLPSIVCGQIGPLTIYC